jgi:hypothetical protein
MLRVNGVRKGVAHADYTIYVHRTFSERRSRGDAHFVRPTGLETTLSESEPQLQLRRGRDKVVADWAEDNLLSLSKKRRQLPLKLVIKLQRMTKGEAKVF